MQVLSTLTYYHPHWTGLTQFARRIAEGLVARGHGVTVLTTRHDRSLPAEEVLHGVRVIRLQPWLFVSRGALVPAWPHRAAALIGEHDVVQIHTPQAEALVIAGLCRLRRTPVLMTHHGDLVMPPGLTNRLVECSVTAAMSAAGRLAAHVTPLSADYAEHSTFLKAFGARVRPISPPVDVPPPQPEAAAAWRRALGLERRRVIGFAGRFVEEKGFDYLLRAVPALAAGEPDVHLVFAGEHRVVYETFYEKCRGLLDRHRDRITSLGLLRDRQQLANFYALCDVFALPSRTDSLASVQIEAMLAGTPVVATDIPGAREVVQRTGMGRLCRPRDPEHLAETLLHVLGHREQYIKTRAHIRAVYDPHRSVCEYERLLLDMVATT